MAKTRSLNFRFSIPLHTRLKIAATTRGMTMQDLGRMVFKEWLKANDPVRTATGYDWLQVMQNPEAYELEIYHCVTAPVERRPVEQGLPKGNYRCPNCHSHVDAAGALRIVPVEREEGDET